MPNKYHQNQPAEPDKSGGQKGSGKNLDFTKTYGDSPTFVKSGDGDGVGSKSKFGKV